MLSVSNAYARPMGGGFRHNSRPTVSHHRPVHHTTVVKRRSNTGGYIALGVFAGLTGMLVGNAMAGNTYVAPTTYVQQPVVVQPAPVVVQAQPSIAQNCVTTVYQSTGQTTMSCYNTPQGGQVVYMP